jgi:hypothetical protein
MTKLNQKVVDAAKAALVKAYWIPGEGWEERCARATLEAGNEWQLITTAPHDGTIVLISDGFYVERAEWHDGRKGQPGTWVEPHESFPYWDSPTHGMPLPEPPVPV